MLLSALLVHAISQATVLSCNLVVNAYNEILNVHCTLLAYIQCMVAMSQTNMPCNLCKRCGLLLGTFSLGRVYWSCFACVSTLWIEVTSYLLFIFAHNPF